MFKFEKIQKFALINPFLVSTFIVILLPLSFYLSFNQDILAIGENSTALQSMKYISLFIDLVYGIAYLGWILAVISYVDHYSIFPQNINYRLLRICFYGLIGFTILFSYPMEPFLDFLYIEEPVIIDDSYIIYNVGFYIVMGLSLISLYFSIYMQWMVAVVLLRAENNVEPTFWKKFSLFLRVFLFLFIFIFPIHKRLRNLSSEVENSSPLLKVFE